MPGGVVPVDEGTRVCGERSTTPSRWKAGSSLGAWCPSTKEQGFAGREAPRRIGGKPVRTRGRGARRRRNKGLRGGKHHAGLEEGRFGPGGVVPVDEGTRVCGERSTTPNWRKAGSDPEPARSAVGWHQKAELLQQLRDIILLSDENRDLISKNPSRIGLVREIHEGVLCGIVGDGSV